MAFVFMMMPEHHAMAIDTMPLDELLGQVGWARSYLKAASYENYDDFLASQHAEFENLTNRIEIARIQLQSMAAEGVRLNREYYDLRESWYIKKNDETSTPSSQPQVDSTEATVDPTEATIDSAEVAADPTEAIFDLTVAIFDPTVAVFDPTEGTEGDAPGQLVKAKEKPTKEFLALLDVARTACSDHASLTGFQQLSIGNLSTRRERVSEMRLKGMVIQLRLIITLLIKMI